MVKQTGTLIFDKSLEKLRNDVIKFKDGETALDMLTRCGKLEAAFNDTNADCENESDNKLMFNGEICYNENRYKIIFDCFKGYFTASSEIRFEDYGKFWKLVFNNDSLTKYTGEIVYNKDGEKLC